MESNANLDSITGDPKKAINKLAYPLMASMLLIMLNNIIDGAWVAGLGPEPLAAIGFITPLFMILVGVGNGVGAGANSLISRYIGAKDRKGANNAAIHSIFVAILVAVVLTLILTVFLRDLLIIMGAISVIDYAMEYGIILFIFTFAILLPPSFGGIFRAEGDIKRATIPMATTAIINMIIDPIFIYTLGMGIGGAAIATVIASLIGLFLMIYWMFIKKDTYFEFKLEYYKRKLQMYKDILIVSIPASLEEFIMALVAIIMNLYIEIIAGTTMVAVFTAGWRIISIGILPAISVGTAAITIAGIAYGAKNIENLRIGARYSVKLGLILSIIVSVIIFVFADQISLMFAYSANSSTLAPMIAEFLRIMVLYILPVPVGATAAFVFQGMGKGPTSLVITLIRELILCVLFAYLLGFVLNLGVLGIYLGLIIGSAIGSVIGYVYLEFYIKKTFKYRIKAN